MDKPVIFAICGKSATGKDYFAHRMYDNFVSHFSGIFYPFIIVSDTTRPPRKNEQNNIDYNFISAYDFEENIQDNLYLEYTYFNGAYYGTNKKNVLITPNSINIGIFNPEGLQKLFKYQTIFDIRPVYLKASLFTRISRMKKREGGFKLQHLKRLYSDHKNFKNIYKILKSYHKYYEGHS